ncbi:hypothetical protein VTK26DRAFT_6706 [Humicola hyalothermophila]
MGHDIVTAVNYYDDPGDGSPPTPVYVESARVINERPMIPVTVTVTDVTGQERSFTLDSHGFQYHSHTSQVKGFHDAQVILDKYYPECEELLKEVTGAARVAVFDHKVRRGPAYWHSLGENNTKSRGPLHRAHVDQSYDGAVMRLREHFPDEADQLMKRRWQIINIWRPISVITSSPLAVADGTTVPDSDLVAASAIFARTGKRRETWTVKANPEAHRWYYKHGQRPDEVILIKCFDSVRDGEIPTVRARRAPHSAVEYPGDEGKGNCWRESVEARCLVFY